MDKVLGVPVEEAGRRLMWVLKQDEEFNAEGAAVVQPEGSAGAPEGGPGSLAWAGCGMEVPVSSSCMTGLACREDV